MKKNKMIYTLAFASMSMFMLSSCNQSTPKVEDNATASKTAQGDLKIAYVEVDSIMSKYTFCKEYSAIMQKKGQNIQNTLGQKEQALQQAASNFQQNMQSNKYTREQAEQIQANLQKQNADLQSLNQRLSNEFQKETGEYNKALSDSIHAFLARYNKDKKYTYILTKQGDNILLADKSCDITNEVIAGLNKEYKSKPKAAK